MVGRGPGIGLLVFGFFLLIIGGLAYSSCAALPTVNGVAPDCSGTFAIVFFGILLLVGGGVVVALQYSRSGTKVPTPVDPSVPPPIIRPVVIQQTVERETVKVRCSYCGNLCDVTAKTCPSCGAPVGG